MEKKYIIGSIVVALVILLTSLAIASFFTPIQSSLTSIVELIFSAGSFIYAHFQVNPLPSGPSQTTQLLPDTYGNSKRKFWWIIGISLILGTLIVLSPIAIPLIPNLGRTLDGNQSVTNSSGLVVTTAIVTAQATITAANATATPTPTNTPSPTPTSTNTPSPTPTSTNTPSPTPINPYYSQGKFRFFDPLLDNSTGNNWEVTSDDQVGGSCVFGQDGYHVTETITTNYKPCHAGFTESNFTFEVSMKIIMGSCGGLSVRDNKNVTAYYFAVCQNGYVGFYRFDNSNKSELLYGKSSTVVVTTYNQTNIVAIVAIDNTFDLWVNHKKLYEAVDNNQPVGLFGVSASGGSEVVFTSAKLWEL